MDFLNSSPDQPFQRAIVDIVARHSSNSQYRLGIGRIWRELETSGRDLILWCLPSTLEEAVDVISSIPEVETYAVFFVRLVGPRSGTDVEIDTLLEELDGSISSSTDSGSSDPEDVLVRVRAMLIPPLHSFVRGLITALSEVSRPLSLDRLRSVFRSLTGFSFSGRDLVADFRLLSAMWGVAVVFDDWEQAWFVSLSAPHPGDVLVFDPLT